jgi:hypothetical protein
MYHRKSLSRLSGQASNVVVNTVAVVAIVVVVAAAAVVVAIAVVTAAAAAVFRSPAETVFIRSHGSTSRSPSRPNSLQVARSGEAPPASCGEAVMPTPRGRRRPPPHQGGGS